MGRIQVICDGKRMLAYDQSVDKVIWNRYTGKAMHLHRFRGLILAYEGRKLYALDPDSGETIIAREFGGQIEIFNPNVDGNRFYVVENNRLHAFGY